MLCKNKPNMVKINFISQINPNKVEIDFIGHDKTFNEKNEHSYL